jgi:hypothetical protein
MLVTFVDLRINGCTVYFEIQFKLQKPVETRGWVADVGQPSVTSGNYSVRIDEHRLKIWGPKTIYTDFKVLTVGHVLDNLISVCPFDFWYPLCNTFT